MSKCALCKFQKKDPRYGEFIQTEEISVHEFCLYLSSALVQRGKDNNGLYGFLPKDIHAEARRAKDLICFYCHRSYASVGCCKNKCRRSFHMICGIENGCENQFSGTYQSYCHSHIHKRQKNPPLNEQCCICYDRLKEDGKPNHRVDFIEAPCCKNGWFHKLCLQNFARTAGYFFKCPLCNNTKKFRSEMPSRGIFVPDRDAAWELEPNAYAELLERPKQCEAKICKHKNGRNAADDERNPLIFCVTCGAVAVHLLCLPKDTHSYTCQECLHIAGPSNNGDSGHESLQNTNGADEIEDIDVCSISDSEEEIDILESYLLSKKRQIIYDSSDSNENTGSKYQKDILNSSNDKTKITQETHNASPCQSQLIYGSTKDNNNESSSDDDILLLRPSLRVKANKHKIDSDESVEAINFKNKKLKNYLNSSSDEDSDESSGSSECLAVKRRKILESKSNQKSKQESKICTSYKEPNTKSLENPQNIRKPLNNLNSVLKSRNDSDSDSVKPKTSDQNSLNISCVANRTRRRRSVYYSHSMEMLSESDTHASGVNNIMPCSTHGDNHPTSSKRHSSIHSSSSYCSFSESLSNSDSSKVSSSTQSLSSYTSERSSSSECSTTRNGILNVSCVANRTRRKSGQYTKNGINMVRGQRSKLSSSSSSSSGSDDFKTTSRQNKIKDFGRNLIRESSTDNSPDISNNKCYGL